MNSRPRQSNSMIVCLVGGDACVYVLGASLMLAVDSLCEKLIRDMRKSVVGELSRC